MSKAYLEGRAEANRCLFCFDAPCKADCPVGIDVPGFIRRILHENLQGSYQLIYRENPLSWICGVLCPTEKLCASRCPRRRMDRAIDIGGLQAYASVRSVEVPVSKERQAVFKTRVAIVGAGPAGLTAALFLSQREVKVDLFDAEEFPGGLITYGIRPDKVDKRRVLQEIEKLLSHPGISIHLKTRISDPHDLLKGHEAVYVATGLGTEEIDERAGRFDNVYPATAFLKKVNTSNLKGQTFKGRLGENVVVIGGGNTAMDAALTARQVGVSNVTIVYRRTEDEMPAWKREVEEARIRGIHLRFLLGPDSFHGKDGRISKVAFQPMKLGRPGSDGRKRVVPGKGPTVTLEVSSVIVATGREVKTPRWLRDETFDPAKGRLGESRIWIGGELRNGVGLIVQAVSDGKEAARQIFESLEEK